MSEDAMESMIVVLREFVNALAQLAALLSEYGSAQFLNQRTHPELLVNIKKTIAISNRLVEVISATNEPPLHGRTRQKLLDVVVNVTIISDQMKRMGDAVRTEESQTEASPALLIAMEMTALHLSTAINYYTNLANYYENGKISSGRIREDKDDQSIELASVKPSVQGRPLDSDSLSLITSNAEGSRLAKEADNLYTLVPVFFATDRGVAKNCAPQHIRFLNRRGDQSLTYGIAEVSIPPVHERGRVERPKWWKFQFKEDRVKHVVITECTTHLENDWKQIAAEHLMSSDGSSALVFIHGFNVSFDDAIRQAAQIGRDIKLNGLVTAYSWTSEFAAEDYGADEDSVRLTVPRLILFLEALKQVGVKTIHIIAHSMGNRALLEALENMTARSPMESCLGEIVMAAPDVDANMFRASISKLNGKAVRYTLYGSESDRAMEFSKTVVHAKYPRAGDGGKNILVISGVETIDATSVGKDLFGLGHSYFSSRRPVLTDLYYLLRESLPASRRDGLSERPHGALRYWIFEPQ